MDSGTPPQTPKSSPHRPVLPGQQVRVATSRTNQGPRGLASGIMVLIRWLQNVTLGLWMGAILALGWLVAVRAQKYFPDRITAGAFLGPLFVRLTQVGLVCSIVVLLLIVLHDRLWKRYHPTLSGDFLTFLRVLLTLVLIAASAYLLFRVWPRMEVLQHGAHVVNGALTGNKGKAFDWWHLQFEKITKGIFAGGLLLMLLSQMTARKK